MTKIEVSLEKNGRFILARSLEDVGELAVEIGDPPQFTIEPEPGPGPRQIQKTSEAFGDDLVAAVAIQEDGAVPLKSALSLLLPAATTNRMSGAPASAS